jgi:Mg/Co/Ni transporter MgtE
VNTDPLIEDFARQSPAGFARSLANGAPDEISALLRDLTPELAIRVAAALPPSRFGAVAAMDLDVLLGWLERSDVDTGVTFVTRLPRGRGLALVDALQNPSLKRRLGRAMRYPEHCVGARLTGDVLRVPAETIVADLLTELRTGDSREPPQAVILDAQNRYSGVLDLWRLMLEENPARHVRDFAIPLTALQPETSIADARSATQWRDHLWLPVADFRGRVLGSVARKALDREPEQTPEPLVDSALLLGQEFFRVSSTLLDSLLRGWSRP